ncbi:MAG: hypothetical protein AAFY56_09270 [Pseudomonadota bacterium]
MFGILRKLFEKNDKQSGVPIRKLSISEHEFVDLGLMYRKSAQWVIPLLRSAVKEGWSRPRLERAIRSYGSQVSKDELRRLGFRGNAHVGEGFLDALTPHGRSRVRGVADEITYYNFDLRLANQTLDRLRNKDWVQWVEIINETPPDPGRVCLMARQLRGKAIAIDRAPYLPLQACDVERCRCSYIVHSKDLEVD